MTNFFQKIFAKANFGQTIKPGDRMKFTTFTFIDAKTSEEAAAFVYHIDSKNDTVTLVRSDQLKKMIEGGDQEAIDFLTRVTTRRMLG